MPIPLLVIALLLLGVVVIASIGYLADQKDPVPLAVAGVPTLLLLAWLVLACMAETPPKTTWETTVATAVSPTGGKVQVAAIEDGGVTVLINLTDRYRRIFPEGSKVRLMRRGRWAYGIYFPTDADGSIELAHP